MLETVKATLTGNADRMMYSYGARQFDERGDVVRKAKELQDLLARTEKEIDDVH